MQELGDCDIIGLGREELGDWDVIVIEELGDSSIQVVGKVMARSIIVGWEDIVEELSDRDIVVGKVLGHSNSILAVEELSDRDVILVEEFVDHVIKELGYGDIVGIQELGKWVVSLATAIQEFCHCNIIWPLIHELGHSNVIRGCL